MWKQFEETKWNEHAKSFINVYSLDFCYVKQNAWYKPTHWKWANRRYFRRNRRMCLHEHFHLLNRTHTHTQGNKLFSTSFFLFICPSAHNYSCGSNFISEFSICSDFGFELVNTYKQTTYICNCHKNTTEIFYLWDWQWIRAPTALDSGSADEVVFFHALTFECGLVSIFHRCQLEWMNERQQFKHLQHIFWLENYFTSFAV